MKFKLIPTLSGIEREVTFGELKNLIKRKDWSIRRNYTDGSKYLRYKTVRDYLTWNIERA